MADVTVIYERNTGPKWRIQLISTPSGLVVRQQRKAGKHWTTTRSLRPAKRDVVEMANALQNHQLFAPKGETRAERAKRRLDVRVRVALGALSANRSINSATKLASRLKWGKGVAVAVVNELISRGYVVTSGNTRDRRIEVSPIRPDSVTSDRNSTGRIAGQAWFQPPEQLGSV